MTPPVVSPTAPDALHAALEAPRSIAVDYRPVVDLRDGTVCGHEAIPRLPGDWHEQAEACGALGAPEAQAIEAALVARPLLSATRFVAVAVSARALASDAVQDALRLDERLDRLVLALVDDGEDADPSELAELLAPLHDRGARIGVDDAGADSFERIVALRPSFVRTDAPPPAALHGLQAEVIAALVDLARLSGADVAVHGVAHDAQLEVLSRLGATHAQGPLLGDPSPVFAGLSRDVRDRLRAWQTPDATLGALRSDVPMVREGGAAGPVVPLAASSVGAVFARGSQIGHVVVVDADGRPVALAERGAHARGETPRTPFALPVDTGAAEAARRAMARAPELRFDPVVCVDAAGACVGAVGVDRLVAALAR